MDPLGILGESLKHVLTEIDARSGRSNWDGWLEVLRAKAQAGDPKAAELLERSRRLKLGDDTSPEADSWAAN